MLRIAVIMGKMHSGGKKNLVMEYYRNIDKTKVQFDFLCDSDSNSIPKEEIENLGGRVYEVAPYQKIYKNMRDIYTICKKNKYTIMHGYNGTMNVFAMFVGFLAGVPIRINESISMAHKSDKKTILKNILKPFSRFCSTHFMANGEECGLWQFGKRLYDRGRVKIFKTVVDTEKNAFNADVRENVREQYNLQDKLVIGHIGRLTSQKNTLFLIDIFKEIYSLNKQTRLLLIGDGNLKEQMLEKIEKYDLKDKVLYLGRREDIQQFYNAMDCFLLPSLYEGLPVVGIEAQTCGLPIVFSSEVPKESSPCNDLGVFVDLSESPEKWAKVVLDLVIRNKDKRHDKSDDIKNAGFDSKTEAIKLQQYYYEILDSKSLV